MGTGLGRNSPVKLTLGRENYEALLERHGQWIRWRIAKKCACVIGPTFSPNTRCKLCSGRGYTYSYQHDQVIQTVAMANDDDGLIELPEDFINDKLVKVYDYYGREYKDAEKIGTFVDIKQKTFKGIYYNFLLERNNVKEVENIELVETNGDNYFIIPDLVVQRPNIDGIYYSAPCDILKVENIVDATGIEFEVEEIRLNKILLREKYDIVYNDDTGLSEEKLIEPIGPLTAAKVEYIEPFIFALLNQNLNKADQQALVEINGDAVAIFPYSCDVAEQDVLTVLAGTITQKEIICRTEDDHDVLPAFFVESISYCTDKNGNELKQDIDFELIGTNQIKWINPDTEPDVGDGYSITFKVYPSYVVMQNVPSLRSSENQRFPKKAIVKYMSSYSDGKKVNRQQ